MKLFDDLKDDEDEFECNEPDENEKKARANKICYYRLPFDFMKDETIEWLEEQGDGQIYPYFYLKLCLCFMSKDGIIYRNVGNEQKPCTIEYIAQKTRVPVGIAQKAMEKLMEVQLVKKMIDGRYYLPNLLDNVIYETGSAQRVRKFRRRHKKKRIMGEKKRMERLRKAKKEGRHEVKLREDFLNQDGIQWLQSQEDGAAYISLYICLCFLALHVPDERLPYNPQWIRTHTVLPFDLKCIEHGIPVLERAGLICIHDMMLTVPDSIFVEKRRA